MANRIGNATFNLDGTTYKTKANNGKHTLHGGEKGFDKKVWKVTRTKDGDSPELELSYTSPDLEESFPGKLDVTVTYVLKKNNALEFHYKAVTDKATPVNLTQHAYFNLAGHDHGDILGHELMVNADFYTQSNEDMIPTGKLEPVKGTPFDFTTLTPIGKRIAALKGEPGGYDLNYVLRDGTEKMHLAARVVEPSSGRMLEVSTSEPGVQFYSGNFLNGKDKGKGGVLYKKHAGFCLETQHFPDSVNQPKFPSIILQPGKTYEHSAIYAFSAK